MSRENDFSSEGGADLGLLGGQVILPIGQKQVARVLNNSGSIFNKSAYQVWEKLHQPSKLRLDHVIDEGRGDFVFLGFHAGNKEYY